MDRNVGPEDRVVRIVVALGLAVLIYFAGLTPTAQIVVGIVAVYLLLTGLFVRDPLYRLVGVDTSVQEQPYSTTDDRSGV
jgi:membrane protein YdbS with pleckstrin-like domain